MMPSDSLEIFQGGSMVLSKDEDHFFCSSLSHVTEIDDSLYFHFLNVLPPLSRSINSFYFAEGYSDIIHFWSETDPSGERRYFCQNTFMKNRLF